MRRAIALAAAFAAMAACCKERTGVVVGPGLTVAPAPPPSAAAAVDAGAVDDDPGPPATATFVELRAAGAPVTFRACEQIVVAVTRGEARALGETLGAGDLLLAQGTGTFEVAGQGTAVLAAVRTKQCEPRTRAGIDHKVVRGSAAKELTWADGKMHARLDAEGDVSPLAYVGRLSGTAAVAEHKHDDTWEVLAAVEAAGTFTLRGVPRRLGAREVVLVPPGTPHSWTPDEGKPLSAVQMYVPPGPEQRFKALAAAGSGRDGGALR